MKGFVSTCQSEAARKKEMDLDPGRARVVSELLGLLCLASSGLPRDAIGTATAVIGVAAGLSTLGRFAGLEHPALWRTTLGHEHLESALALNLANEERQICQGGGPFKIRAHPARTIMGSRMKSSMMRALASRSVGFMSIGMNHCSGGSLSGKGRSDSRQPRCAIIVRPECTHRGPRF